MALNCMCPKGHSYIQCDLYPEWNHDGPICPQCFKEWKKTHHIKQKYSSKSYHNSVYRQDESSMACACGNKEFLVNFIPSEFSGNYLKLTCPKCGYSEVIYDDYAQEVLMVDIKQEMDTDTYKELVELKRENIAAADSLIDFYEYLLRKNNIIARDENGKEYIREKIINGQP